MIVCSCLGLNDRTVRAAILAGASDVDDVTAMCGAGGDCRTCRVTIADMIDEQYVQIGGAGTSSAAA